MAEFSARLFRLQRSLGIKKKEEIAQKLGVSRTMLYNYEQGNPQPPAEILSTLATLEEQAGIEHLSTVGEVLKEETVVSSLPIRMIPVVGWAHAGTATSYEELPVSWQERVPTECRDKKAFAVRLEGDSMEPKFSESDLLIVQPSEEIYSGCLAVLRFASDGVLFRRVEVRESSIILVPLNDRYKVEEVPKSDILWAYPVWGMWRQVWK